MGLFLYTFCVIFVTSLLPLITCHYVPLRAIYRQVERYKLAVLGVFTTTEGRCSGGGTWTPVFHIFLDGEQCPCVIFVSH